APPTALSTLSLHDALPISAGSPRRTDDYRAEPVVLGRGVCACWLAASCARITWVTPTARTTTSASSAPANAAGSLRRAEVQERRSEEHTSELQSRSDLVCR